MSGGFFRGTSADQDTRFSNKQAKLMKSQKFAPELENLVDMTKVKMDVMRPWIAHRVTELLGFEDEVLINFIYGLLEEKVVNGKEIQISLTGFMEKNTGKFMKELWTHLLSAQKNASGVPQEFLDAKVEEARKKKVETDRITSEIQRKKEKEGQELEQERMKTMDGDDGIYRAKNAAMEPSSRHQIRDSTMRSADEKDVIERNGSRGRSRVSRSPHPSDRSPASPRRIPSRSISKSPNSRSISNGRRRSRSISVSPQPGRHSVSSGKVRRSPSRLSVTPRRRDSPRQSLSPPRREAAQFRRRSVSRSRFRSPSPMRRRMRSPMRRRSRSPMRRRSRSPVRRRSRSPIRRRSRSPVRRRSRSPIRHRSRSPFRRRSRSPIRRRSRSPIRRRSRSPIRRRSRSPVRYRSRSPVRRRSRSPLQRRSESPMLPVSPSPVQRGSPSPAQRSSLSPGPGRSPSPVGRLLASPVRRRSRSPVRHRSRSPVRCRSPSPMMRRYRRAPSTPRRRSPSPMPHRPSVLGRRRSPSPGRRSPSSQGRTSLSPVHRAPGRRSPKRLRRSPLKSPRDGLRTIEKYSPGRRAPPRERAERTVESGKGSGSSERRPPVSERSPQRNLRDRNGFRNKVPALSPSQFKSPSNSESPPAARKRSTVENRRSSGPESPAEQKKETAIHVDSPSPLNMRKDKPSHDSSASVKHEEIHYAREEDKKSKSLGKRTIQLSMADEHKNLVEKAYYKKEPSPERLPTRRSGEVRSRADNVELRKDQKTKSENVDGRVSYPDHVEEESPRTYRNTLPSERSRSRQNDAQGHARPDDSENVSKLSRKVDVNDRSGSVDSGSEESDERRAEVKEKRKHKRSKRKDVTSDDDDSYDSHIEGRKEAKRRRKEEKRLKKEERRRRRAERRRRREDRHAEKHKKKPVGNISPPSDFEKNHDGSASDGERVARKESRATDSDDAVSEQKRLEIELREKALESLRAKKGAGH